MRKFFLVFLFPITLFGMNKPALPQQDLSQEQIDSIDWKTALKLKLLRKSRRNTCEVIRLLYQVPDQES